MNNVMHLIPTKGFWKDIETRKCPNIANYLDFFVCCYLNLLICKMDTVGKNGSRPQ